MHYLIAIDGGGTKTESVLFTSEGNIIKRDVTAGVNALDATMPVVCKRLSGAVERLAAALPAGEKLRAIYGGIAGSVDYFPGVLKRELFPGLPCDTIRMEGDGGNLIAAMRGHTDGCSLISGTGSSLYIRTGDKLQRYGGWGYLIDTGGSGYTLGRDAFYAAFRSLDGRGPKSVLYDLVREKMGVPPEDNVPLIYERGRPYIASFACTVFKARAMGDAVAGEIFYRAVTALTELIKLGENALGKDFTVVTGGGIFAAYPDFWQAVRDGAPRRASLVQCDVPVMLGAAVEALWDAGEKDTPAFRERFLSDYTSMVTLTTKHYGGEDCGYESIYR